MASSEPKEPKEPGINRATPLINKAGYGSDKYTTTTNSGVTAKTAKETKKREKEEVKLQNEIKKQQVKAEKAQTKREERDKKKAKLTEQRKTASERDKQKLDDKLAGKRSSLMQLLCEVLTNGISYTQGGTGRVGQGAQIRMERSK